MSTMIVHHQLTDEQKKEQRREKAAWILRNKGYGPLADILIGKAEIHDHVDQIRAAIEDKSVARGIVSEWLRPMVDVYSESLYRKSFERWVMVVSFIAGIVFRDEATRDDAFEAVGWIQSLYELELSFPLIEQIVQFGSFSDEENRVFMDYPELANVRAAAQAAPERSKAKTLINGIVDVLRTAKDRLFERTKPEPRPFQVQETREVRRPMRSGKTERERLKKNAQQQRRADRSARDAAYRASRRGKGGSNEVRGKGKQSRRQASDPNRSGK